MNSVVRYIIGAWIKCIASLPHFARAEIKAILMNILHIIHIMQAFETFTVNKRHQKCIFTFKWIKRMKAKKYYRSLIPRISIGPVPVWQCILSRQAYVRIPYHIPCKQTDSGMLILWMMVDGSCIFMCFRIYLTKRLFGSYGAHQTQLNESYITGCNSCGIYI